MTLDTSPNFTPTEVSKQKYTSESHATDIGQVSERALAHKMSICSSEVTNITEQRGVIEAIADSIETQMLVHSLAKDRPKTPPPIKKSNPRGKTSVVPTFTVEGTEANIEELSCCGKKCNPSTCKNPKCAKGKCAKQRSVSCPLEKPECPLYKKDPTTTKQQVSSSSTKQQVSSSSTKVAESSKESAMHHRVISKETYVKQPVPPEWKSPMVKALTIASDKPFNAVSIDIETLQRNPENLSEVTHVSKLCAKVETEDYIKEHEQKEQAHHEMHKTAEHHKHKHHKEHHEKHLKHRQEQMYQEQQQFSMQQELCEEQRKHLEQQHYEEQRHQEQQVYEEQKRREQQIHEQRQYQESQYQSSASKYDQSMSFSSENVQQSVEVTFPHASAKPKGSSLFTRALTIAPDQPFSPTPHITLDPVPLPPETVPYIPNIKVTVEPKPPPPPQPKRVEACKSPFVQALTTAPDRPYSPMVPQKGTKKSETQDYMKDLPPPPKQTVTMLSALTIAADRPFTPVLFSDPPKPIEFSEPTPQPTQPQKPKRVEAAPSPLPAKPASHISPSAFRPLGTAKFNPLQQQEEAQSQFPTHELRSVYGKGPDYQTACQGQQQQIVQQQKQILQQQKTMLQQQQQMLQQQQQQRVVQQQDQQRQVQQHEQNVYQQQEQQRVEQQRMEQQRMEQKRMEQQRMEQQRKEQQRMEQQRMEQQRMEQQRMAQQQEQQRLAQQQEQQRKEQQRMEQQRIAQQQEQQRMAQQKEHQRKEQQQQQRMAQEQQRRSQQVHTQVGYSKEYTQEDQHKRHEMSRQVLQTSSQKQIPTINVSDNQFETIRVKVPIQKPVTTLQPGQYQPNIPHTSFQPVMEDHDGYHGLMTHPPHRPISPSMINKPAPAMPYYQQNIIAQQHLAVGASLFDPQSPATSRTPSPVFGRSASPYDHPKPRAKSPAPGPPPNPLESRQPKKVVRDSRYTEAKENLQSYIPKYQGRVEEIRQQSGVEASKPQSGYDRQVSSFKQGGYNKSDTRCDVSQYQTQFSNQQQLGSQMCRVSGTEDVKHMQQLSKSEMRSEDRSADRMVQRTKKCTEEFERTQKMQTVEIARSGATQSCAQSGYVQQQGAQKQVNVQKKADMYQQQVQQQYPQTSFMRQSQTPPQSPVSKFQGAVPYGSQARSYSLPGVGKGLKQSPLANPVPGPYSDSFGCQTGCPKPTTVTFQPQTKQDSLPTSRPGYQPTPFAKSMNQPPPSKPGFQPMSQPTKPVSHSIPVPFAKPANATKTPSGGASSSNVSQPDLGTGGKQAGAVGVSPKRGRGILNMAAGPGSRVPLCAQCNSQIRGPFITALGKIWCPEHFICTTPTCRRPLQDMGFVEEQGQLYCEYCFEQYLAPVCSKCNTKIKGDCLNAIGKHFHPECFLCAYCGKLFGNSPFFLEDGLPYCEADWNELFTTKCFACGFPVEAGDRWVEALNNNYHSQCFNCTMCKKNLEGQSFFAKGGRPFCKNHAR